MKDFKGNLGALIMGGFSIFSLYRFLATGLIFYGLLGFRDGLACWFLGSRRPSVASSSFSGQLIAYTSSAMPFVYWKPEMSVLTNVQGLTVNLLVISGFLISTLATVELGVQFGVSPAFRGRLCGVYRWVSHPMYLGYAVTEMSWILIHPVNGIFYAISLIGYFLRARRENAFLNDHPQLQRI